MSKRTRRAVVGLACIATMAIGASAAHAQTGGTPGGTAPPSSSPPPSTSGGYTVVQKATWYGPGFWGHATACGMTLQPSTLGVANKTLPCGTNVTFTYNGVSVAATVIDRGPFRKGYAWDLTKKVAKQLGFLEVGAGTVQATISPSA